MILKLIAVYDMKASFYASPLAMRSQGEAIRSFSQVVNDETTPMGKNPEDYSLFQIGEYDDSSGIINANATPKLIISALELINQD